MLLGGFCFSCMGLGIKFLGTEMDSFQIAFLRALFGFFVILPFALRRGISGLKTHVIKLHIARGIVGILGMMSIFFAITHLPLADAVALTFTRPLFLILLAVLFLGETIRWRRWTATAVVASASGSCAKIVAPEANKRATGIRASGHRFCSFFMGMVPFE